MILDYTDVVDKKEKERAEQIRILQIQGCEEVPIITGYEIHETKHGYLIYYTNALTGEEVEQYTSQPFSIRSFVPVEEPLVRYSNRNFNNVVIADKFLSRLREQEKQGIVRIDYLCALHEKRIDNTKFYKASYTILKPINQFEVIL